MEFKNKKKLLEAVQNLKKALSLYDKGQIDPKLSFLTCAKSFEVVVEYFWKELKYLVEAEGLDAASPKEAIRKGAQLKFIKEPGFWLDCINARNDSVHDYFSIPERDYIKLAKEFLKKILIITKANAEKQ